MTVELFFQSRMTGAPLVVAVVAVLLGGVCAELCQDAGKALHAMEIAYTAQCAEKLDNDVVIAIMGNCEERMPNEVTVVVSDTDGGLLFNGDVSIGQEFEITGDPILPAELYFTVYDKRTLLQQIRITTCHQDSEKVKGEAFGVFKVLKEVKANPQPDWGSGTRVVLGMLGGVIGAALLIGLVFALAIKKPVPEHEVLPLLR